MACYTKKQLEKMGFKALGESILISDKACIYNCEQVKNR